MTKRQRTVSEVSTSALWAARASTKPRFGCHKLDFWGRSCTSMAADGVSRDGDLTLPMLRDLPPELVRNHPDCVQSKIQQAPVLQSI